MRFHKTFVVPLHCTHSIMPNVSPVPRSSPLNSALQMHQYKGRITPAQEAVALFCCKDTLLVYGQILSNMIPWAFFARLFFSWSAPSMQEVVPSQMWGLALPFLQLHEIPVSLSLCLPWSLRTAPCAVSIRHVI